MFQKFFAFMELPRQDVTGGEELVKKFAGCAFRGGLYRLFETRDIPKWNAIIVEAFPPAEGDVQVFGHDWAGRVFALSLSSGTVVIFDPGTGDALDTEHDLADFHNIDIPEKHRVSLLSESFGEWKAAGGAEPQYGQCVGFKVPLFLGGQDTVENLEISDMEVYWGIMGQLMD